MKIRYIIFFTLLIFSFPVWGNDCKFSGEVHPKTKTAEVREVYEMACLWFTKNFLVKIDPDITLNHVYYIDSWDSVTELSLGDTTGLAGLLFDVKDKHKNNIYLNIKKNPFDKGTVVENSIVFHEIIHFFVKASNWSDDPKEIRKLYKNMSLHEAFAYFAQNEYIKMVTNGEKELLDYCDCEKEKISKGTHFIFVSEMLQMFDYDKFLYNGILFFSNDAEEKYKKLITKKYPAFSFRAFH